MQIVEIDSLRSDVEDYLIVATKFRDRKSNSSLQEYIKENGISAIA